MPATATAGSTEALLLRFGRTHAVLVRGGSRLIAAAIAPWVDAAIGFAGAVLVSVTVVGWTALFAERMLRAPSTFWAVADVALVGLLASAVSLVDDPELLAGHSGWVIVVVALTIVSSHWHLRPAAAWATTLSLATAYFLGCSAAIGPGEVAFASAWLVLGGGLSAVAWGFVRRGGRAADRMVGAQLDAQRSVSLAAARRADQRRHWAAVHDTAATTLLMIGTGEVRDDAVWLRKQVERDIATLDGVPGRDGGDLVDVVATLENELTGSAVATHVDHEPDRRPMAPPVVAEAFSGAASEAVENVRRHSGARSARIRVDQLGGRVVVVVSDAGRGFDMTAPSGRGICWSIVDRLESVGGRARVESCPGQGTTVRLEWPVD